MAAITDINTTTEVNQPEIIPEEQISREIIGDASFFTTCTYIYQAAAFAVGIVTKRFLGPEGAGVWSFFIMVLSYFALQHLGMIDGSERQIAFYRGKGMYDYARKIKDNMFGTVSLLSIVVAFCTAIFALSARSYLSEHLYWALIHISFVLPVFLAVTYVTVALRATKRFKLLGSTYIGVAVLNLTVGITLVWRFHLTGMFLAFCMVNGLNLIAWYFLTRKDEFLSFKFKFNKSIAREVLKIGFPITLFGLVWTVLRTVDSMLVVFLYGTRELGFYALGVSINTFIYHAPNAFSVVMFPRFQERYGRSSDIGSLINFVLKPTAALSFFALPILLGSAFFLIPPLIEAILPKFIPGIIPLKILLGGTYWLSLTILPSHFLITINKQSRIVLFGLFGVALSFTGTVVAYKLSWGLQGTAALVATAYSFYYGVLFYYAGSHFNRHVNRIKYLSRTLACFVWIVLSAVACDIYIADGNGVLARFIYAGVKFTAFLILTSPLMIYAEKQTQVVSKCLEYLKGTIRSLFTGLNHVKS